MKRTTAMLTAIILSLLLLFGCSDEKIGAENEDNALPNEPAALGVEDLDAILDALDISGATISSRGAAECTYDAAAAIRAEMYLDELRTYVMRVYIPQSDWNSEDALRYCIQTPEVTLFQYEEGIAYPLRVTTGTGESWFIMKANVELDSEDSAEQYGWMLQRTLSDWYREARAAALCAEGGTPLTAEELSWFDDFTTSSRSEYNETWGDYVNVTMPVSCFFTSLYNDVRDLDAEAFIQYFPTEGAVSNADGEEARLVAEKLDRRGEDGQLLSIDSLPVPCHRIPRETLDEVLMQYAGVTVAEMHTDWKEELFYLPETDCFYTFTSDYGPGMFSPVYGERSGDLVTLRGAMNTEAGTVKTLRLEKAGDEWHILSHLAEVPPQQG